MGVKTPTPCELARPASAIAAAVSRRKQMLSPAASSAVSGGTRRVLTDPARGALVMMPSAQSLRALGSGIYGLRIRWLSVIRPNDQPLVLLAKRVLITPVLPDLNAFPRILAEEIFECARTENGRFARLAITAWGSQADAELAMTSGTYIGTR